MTGKVLIQALPGSRAHHGPVVVADLPADTANGKQLLVQFHSFAVGQVANDHQACGLAVENGPFGFNFGEQLGAVAPAAANLKAPWHRLAGGTPAMEIIHASDFFGSQLSLRVRAEVILGA